MVSCTGEQAPAPVHYYGSSGGAGVSGIHTVRYGDTLWSISNRYNLAMQDVILANDLAAPFTLKTGQRLTLPPPREYKVRDGDTLYSVSLVTGVGQNAIARLNNLKSPYIIYGGQVLRLPSSSPEPLDYKVASSKEENNAYPSPKPSPPRQLKTPPRSSNAKFAKPAQGRIISSFGAKSGGLHNDGINIAAPKGAPVVAAENGVVAYSGDDLKGFGNLVLVRHADGWVSAYAHMGNVSVKQGQTLARGQKIGEVGTSGDVSSPQLHFELRKGTKAKNPSKYI